MPECQVCGFNELQPVINLGYMPPVNWMEPVGTPAGPQTWLPTEMVHCPKCELVQLGCVPDPAVVFPPHYPYTSASTRILRDNFEDLAQEAIEKCRLKPGDLVVDVGSNDGTLLKAFKKRGMKVLGVEPTDVADLANKNGIKTIKGFFGVSLASMIEPGGKADLVTCCNCFAHMPDPNGIVGAIKMILKPGGTFVSESHYLIDLLSTTQYDTIYHEHLRYYSVESLSWLLNRNRLAITKVKSIPTHGGSIRVYASAVPNHLVDVDNILDAPFFDEPRKEKLNLVLSKFKDDVLRSRRDLVSTVHRLKTQGRVVGIGAPSRASVVVNYCRLDSDLIDYVCELPGSMKIGRYMPGTRIPVVDEARLYHDQPEAAIVFSWHIFDEVEKNVRAKGYKGELVKPI